MAHWNEETIEKFTNELAGMGGYLFKAAYAGTSFRPTMEFSIAPKSGSELRLGDVERLIRKYDDKADKENNE